MSTRGTKGRHEDENHGGDPDDDVAAPVPDGRARADADEAEDGDAKKERAVVAGTRDERDGGPEVGHLGAVPIGVEVHGGLGHGGAP